MTDYDRIYRERADDYDRLVAAEDAGGRLLPAIEAVARLDQVLEIGAGTGRITRLLVGRSRRIIATERAPAMIEVARRRLGVAAHFALADAAALPVADGWATAAIAGWVFGHQTAWNPDDWRSSIARCLDQMERALAPGGTAIVIETLGTGRETPAPPRPELAAYYQWLEEERGFARSWLRTDYAFADAGEAEALCGFFFGPELAARVARERLTGLPECTGLWHRRR